MNAAVSRARPPATPHEALDRATLVAAKRGEPWAARRLVECTQRSVHRFVWRMLGPRAHRATVEELVQDTYARVFRALPRYDVDGAARFTTWMLTLAHRTVIDELRRKRPQLLPLEGTSEGTPQQRPDRQRERADLGERIAAAVEQLSPSLRAAFILRAYHDRTYPEIAEALGVDLGTVKSRIHRARKALMAALEEVRHDG
ncbi:MAG: RNA polymerase sigma factor [Myxococcota bacterium]